MKLDSFARRQARDVVLHLARAGSSTYGQKNPKRRVESAKVGSPRAKTIGLLSFCIRVQY